MGGEVAYLDDTVVPGEVALQHASEVLFVDTRAGKDVATHDIAAATAQRSDDEQSTVARVVTLDGDLAVAVAGQSVTITLAEEVDVSRGDVLATAAEPPAVADQFEAHVIWMGEHEMLAGRPYLMKIGTRTVGLSIGSAEVPGGREHARAARRDDAPPQRDRCLQPQPRPGDRFRRVTWARRRAAR